jgi:hypothetical protein
MKKILFLIFAVAAIAVAAVWNVSRNMNEEALSDVTLANVEALADSEGTKPCSGYGSVLCSYNNIWVYNQ